MMMVSPDSFYMSVWEEDLTKDGKRAEFEPDYTGGDLIYLGNERTIYSKETLKKAVEEFIFGKDSFQFDLEEFTCHTHEFGWTYVGLFIMDDGSKIKQDSKAYTHVIRYHVEIKFFKECNALDCFTK